MSTEVEETPSAPTLTEFCPGGDLTLLVSQDAGSVTHRILVSRMTLCLASPVWRAMLTGRFAEAEKDEISLVDDDPEALLTVLRVAHLRFYEVPKSLSLPQFVNIATVCDKYDTVAICRPFVAKWAKPWFQETQISPGLPLMEKRYLLARNDAWLWVAWVFGYQEHFINITKNLSRTVTTDVKGSCLRFGLGLSGSAAAVHSMTPGITESLLKVRQATVEAMLNIYYTYLAQVLDRKSCKARPSAPQVSLFSNPNPNSDCCHAIALGTLVAGLKPLGKFYFHHPPANSIYASAFAVYGALYNIKIPEWKEPYSLTEKDHKICDFTAEMKAKLDSVYSAMPSPVLDSHILHMQKQWAKGQTTP